MSSDEDLTTLLTRDQQSDLMILLASILERMHQNLAAALNGESTSVQQERSHQANPNVETQVDKEALEAERKLPHPKLMELKPRALASFDEWRDKVLGRIGDVLNSSETVPKAAQKGPRSLFPVADSRQTGTGDEPRNWFPPVETPLVEELPASDAPLITHAVLLLLLSLENYDARSRTLLLYLCASLNVPLSVLIKLETATAESLVRAAVMNADGDVRKRIEDGKNTKRWKIGLASVAGAALIGITGGLAAPLVAAGIGTLMGGIGLGGTVAAAYLGALASSGAIVGSLFGAYGGKITGDMMKQYASEVEDFSFIPLDENTPGRLRVTIGISGWITHEEEITGPWRMLINDEGSNAYALRWEMKALLNLGTALESMATSFAIGYIRSEIIRRAVAASLYAALWPIALLNFARIVDNPFSVAKARAEKAGLVLADAIINRAQGRRPLTLIGFSLGARIVYTCLLSLAERNAFGLIENAVLIGAPVPSNGEAWATMRSVVAGRLVNVYSEKDLILAFLYRTSAIQLGISGITPIKGVEGVENVDMGEIVEGHLVYVHLTSGIWKEVSRGEAVFDGTRARNLETV